MSGRDIQGNDIANAFYAGILEVQNNKAREDSIVYFCDDDSGLFRLGEAPHRAARKAKRSLKANDVERVHCLQVIRAIRT